MYHTMSLYGFCGYIIAQNVQMFDTSYTNLLLLLNAFLCMHTWQNVSNYGLIALINVTNHINCLGLQGLNHLLC